MLQIQIDSKSLIDQLSVCIAKQVIRALELFRVFFNEQIRDGHMESVFSLISAPAGISLLFLYKETNENVLFN